MTCRQFTVFQRCLYLIFPLRERLYCQRVSSCHTSAWIIDAPAASSKEKTATKKLINLGKRQGLEDKVQPRPDTALCFRGPGPAFPTAQCCSAPQEHSFGILRAFLCHTRYTWPKSQLILANHPGAGWLQPFVSKALVIS